MKTKKTKEISKEEEYKKIAKGETIERSFTLTVKDIGNNRNINMAIENFSIHDLLGVIEVAKKAILDNPPNEIQNMKSYIG